MMNVRRWMAKAVRQPGYAAQVAIKRLAAQAARRWGGGRAPLPESITLFLTHRCNLRCRMCGQWGEGGVTRKVPAESVAQELTAAELKGFVESVAPFRPNITLFGGEPFLHPGAVELIEAIKAGGLHCLVITNASLIEPVAERIVAAGLDELNVSLDGSGSVHDGIRGMPGLFERIMRGLDAVRQAKERRGASRPLINIQCTITKYNIAHLEDMTDVAREAGAASLTFHHLIFLNDAVIERQRPYDEKLGCRSDDWRGFVSEPGIDPAALWEKMRAIPSAARGLALDFYPHFSRDELIAYYTAPVAASAAMSGCASPWIAAYVFPDGEVRPCLNSTYSFGSIRRERFPKI